MAKQSSGSGTNIPEWPEAAMDMWLGEIRKAERPLARRALSLAGEALVSEAQLNAPVKSGFLKASHVKAPREDADEVRIGASAVYGLAVHQRHPDPSKRHWFLRSIVRNAGRIFERSLKAAADRLNIRGGDA